MSTNDYQKLSSPANSQIKFLEKLKAGKHRQTSGQFLVENLTLIRDALTAGHDFAALFVTETFASKHVDDLAQIQAVSTAPNFYLLDDHLNKKFSSLDTPSGIAALYERQERVLDSGPVIYLNAISDPGNLGTIMRSALAFDLTNLVLDCDCVDAYNPKVIAAAKDAFFKLNFIEDQTGEWLAACQLPIYASSSHASTDLADFQPAAKYCLVLGNETRGISPAIMARAEQDLKIAISPKIESINVATAATVIFYEFKRKRNNKN